MRAGENLLKDISGELFDIQLQADLAGAKKFGIKCRGQPVTFSAANSELTCLGKAAKVNTANGRLTLRILVDRTSLEVFADDGKVSMSSCFLPGPQDLGLELFSDGGNLKIVSLTIYELESAWPARDKKTGN